MRFLKNFIKKLIISISNFRFSNEVFAREKVAKSDIKSWYSFEISQPIIRPHGQNEGSYKSKIHNTRIAIEKIGFLKIKPGELFSFWGNVGNPDRDMGFKQGAMLTKDNLIFTDGGGLCQISTVIYAVALHFGCKILKRNNHLYDIYGEDRYYLLGQDATVAYPEPDLVFKNNFEDSIVINCRIEKNNIVATIHSPFKCFDVEVESSTIEFLPRKVRYVNSNHLSSLFDIGADGKKVRTVRKITYPSGKKLCKIISNDTYKPLPRIVRQ